MTTPSDIEAMISFFDTLGYEPPESAVNDPHKYVAACSLALFDLSSEQLAAACVEYARRGGRAWPKPRDLLDVLRIDVEAQADMVWGELRRVPWNGFPQREARHARTWCLGANPDVDLELHDAVDAALYGGIESTPMHVWWPDVRGAPWASLRAGGRISRRAYETVAAAVSEHPDDDPPATRGAWWLDDDADEHARRMAALDAAGGWRAVRSALPATPTSTAMQATFRRVYAERARRDGVLLSARAGQRALEGGVFGSGRGALTARGACDSLTDRTARPRGGRSG